MTEFKKFDSIIYYAIDQAENVLFAGYDNAELEDFVEDHSGEVWGFDCASRSSFDPDFDAQIEKALNGEIARSC